MKFKIHYLLDKKIKQTIVNSQSINSLKYYEQLPLNIINIKEHKKLSINNILQKDEKLELIYEIKTMLNSHLSFEDIINLLLKNKYSNINIEVLTTIKYALENGQKIYKAIEVHKKYLGIDTILFFKIAQNNSNIQVAMNALYEILNKNKKLKSDILNALTYPAILLVSLFISVFVIFTFVLDKFEYIFTLFGDNLPIYTKILLDIKYIFSEYYLFIFISIFFILIFFNILYKKFQIFFDKILLNNIMPFSSLYKNILFYRLFLSLHLLVKSNNKFQDALHNSKEIITNKYFSKQLNNILKDMNNGLSISKSFSNTHIFDLSTISLLKIAQETNNIEEILNDIKKIYNKKVKKSIKNFKTFLEPLMILLLASIILYLVLAILTPIWDLSTVIK